MDEICNGIIRNEFFHVFKHGRLTVVGFDARNVDNPAAAPQCQKELLDLIDEHKCDILVVELMGLGVVSSWILGILAAVRTHGIEVHLYHPTGEMKDVLQLTKLDQLLHDRSIQSS